MDSIDSIRHLADLLRSERLSAGLTQQRLADRAGVSRWWISEFEGGRARADLGHLLRVLDALGLRLQVVRPQIDDAARARGVDLDHLLEEHRGS